MKKKERWIISLLSFPFPPRSSGTCSFAALKCCPVTPEGPRGSSPAGNQPSFFHEAVSVQESLWISPAASASNTSCYTLGNMTTALPPSSLHLNALQHPVTPWVKSDLSPLVSRELRTMANGLLMAVLVKEINWNQTIILWLFAPPSDDIWSPAAPQSNIANDFSMDRNTSFMFLKRLICSNYVIELLIGQTSFVSTTQMVIRRS